MGAHFLYIPTDQCIDNKEFFQASLFLSSSSFQVGSSQVLDYDTQQPQPMQDNKKSKLHQHILFQENKMNCIE
jgi:hypothetical protein